LVIRFGRLTYADFRQAPRSLQPLAAVVSEFENVSAQTTTSLYHPEAQTTFLFIENPRRCCTKGRNYPHTQSHPETWLGWPWTPRVSSFLHSSSQREQILIEQVSHRSLLSHPGWPCSCSMLLIICILVLTLLFLEFITDLMTLATSHSQSDEVGTCVRKSGCSSSRPGVYH
jgi:hypothetical protein